MLHYAENKADRLEYDLGVYTKTLNFCLSNNASIIFFFSQTIYLAIEVIHIDQTNAELKRTRSRGSTMTNRQGSGEVTYRLRKDHFSKKRYH